MTVIIWGLAGALAFHYIIIPQLNLFFDILLELDGRRAHGGQRKRPPSNLGAIRAANVSFYAGTFQGRFFLTSQVCMSIYFPLFVRV